MINVLCVIVIVYVRNYVHVYFVFLIGGFGYVFVAQDVSTGKDYALKVRVCVCTCVCVCVCE